MLIHLLRTLPPRQTVRLTTRFDEKLREAFSHLIAIDSEPGMLNDLWWKQVKLPRKFGGMHLRSGALTGAAQYAQSVVKTAPDVLKIIGDSYDPKIIIERDAKRVLDTTLGPQTKLDVAQVVQNDATALVEGRKLSLAQWCELVEARRIFEHFSPNEK